MLLPSVTVIVRVYDPGPKLSGTLPVNVGRYGVLSTKFSVDDNTSVLDTEDLPGRSPPPISNLVTPPTLSNTSIFGANGCPCVTSYTAGDESDSPLVPGRTVFPIRTTGGVVSVASFTSLFSETVLNKSLLSVT